MTPSSPSILLSPRLAGLLYLAVIGLGLFGEGVVRGGLVVSGDAAATARNILADESLWRLGIAGDLTMHLLDVPLIVFFYLLLRPVSPALALLATAFNLVQTCVLALNKLSLVAVLSLLAVPPDAPGALEAPTLAMGLINLHGAGFAIGLLFFGVTCVLRGALIVRSGYVPRTLGALLVLAGLCYLVNSFALLLSPTLAAALFPAVLMPAFVAELLLSLWLLQARPQALREAMAARLRTTAA